MLGSWVSPNTGKVSPYLPASKSTTVPRAFAFSNASHAPQSRFFSTTRSVTAGSSGRKSAFYQFSSPLVPQFRVSQVFSTPSVRTQSVHLFGMYVFGDRIARAFSKPGFQRIPRVCLHELCVEASSTALTAREDT